MDDGATMRCRWLLTPHLGLKWKQRYNCETQRQNSSQHTEKRHLRTSKFIVDAGHAQRKAKSHPLSYLWE